MRARHRAQIVYSLPFARGTRFEVTQGYRGSFSHNGAGAFAVDFAMPIGTPVRAARGGRVVSTRDDVTTTVRRKPPGHSNGIPANDVVILHEDGTVGWYMHFRPGGVEVAIGSYVREGDIIGTSGDTGLSSQPHLHFEVYKPVDGYVRQTIPVRFHVKGETRPIELREGRFYEPH
jgi:murein DD-endopeptidase MepM/ murein hydrolase activator NlpD